MIDSAADDDYASEDDMRAYKDTNLDEYDYTDGFVRGEDSDLTEYASDEESDDEDDSNSDSNNSEADDESGDKSDDEHEETKQASRPSDEELRLLPMHPLHTDSPGGERKKQDEQLRTFSTRVLDGLIRIGEKVKKYRSEKSKKK